MQEHGAAQQAAKELHGALLQTELAVDELEHSMMPG